MRALPRLAVATALAVGLTAAPALAADYRAPVDLTFPTEPGVTYSDDFDQSRSGGRRHLATDLLGEKLMEVYAAVDGTISGMPAADEPEPSYGWSLTIAGDDGRSYSYIHLNDDSPGTDDGRGGHGWAYAPGLSEGTRVERGQWVAYLGDSGNAESTAPHLHFSIHDPAVRDPYGSDAVNPFASLRDAEERGDYAAGDQSSGSRDGSPEATTASRAPGPPVERVAGDDRVATSVALSARSFDQAPAAVVAPAFVFADAVVAGPLAAVLGGPVLTSGGDRLDERVGAELARLGVARVTIVGGTTVLGPQVEADLAAAGYRVDRIAGLDEAATAAAVARRVWRLTGVADDERRALVALGTHPQPSRAWPDALTAGWHGAVNGAPVLLVGPDEASAETLEALTGVAEAVLVGGPVALSVGIEQAVDERVGTVRRLAGDDRFATALAVADDLAVGPVPPSRAELHVATGFDYADALAAGVAVARARQTLVLVDGAGTGADGQIDGWLAEHGPEVGALVVLGGPNAVGDDALADLRRRLAG